MTKKVLQEGFVVDTIYMEVYRFYMKTLANCLMLESDGTVTVSQTHILALIAEVSIAKRNLAPGRSDALGCNSQLRSWAI